MIKAVLFDLDGTLVQTEKLKAISYARAAVELAPGELTEPQVIEAFKEVVGLSRREVAVYLMKRFDLEDEAAARLDEFGVHDPWQAYVQVRLRIYEAMLDDHHILQDHLCPHNVELLNDVLSRGLPTGLATMSYRMQANRVLKILELKDKFNFVTTRDDVEHGKPDPEIYLLVAHQLGVEPQECLVIEDSSSGVSAALNAGMFCIAVTTEFTHAKVHQLKRLEEEWIVDHPRNLRVTAMRMLDAHGS